MPMAPPKNPADKSPRNAYREAFEAGTKQSASPETLARCAELEAAVDSLKVRYEQYFLGLSRLPPLEDHALIRSALIQLRASFVRNTSARFRVQSLHNRFLSYERMWQRTLREIEEGTYRRDLYKARLRTRPASAEGKPAIGNAKAAEKSATPSAEGDEDFDVDESAEPAASAPVASQPRHVPAPAAATRSPARTGPAELSDDRLKPLFEAYVAAKKRCKESTDGLTFEAVAGSLRRQVPSLLQQHGATSVDFKVVIKGGKAVLKAVPR